MATQTFDMLDINVVSFVNNGETNDVEMLKLNDNVIWEKYPHIVLQAQRAYADDPKEEMKFRLEKSVGSGEVKYRIDNGNWTIGTVASNYKLEISIPATDLSTIHTLEVIGAFDKINSVAQSPEQTSNVYYPNVKITSYGFKELALGEGMLASSSSSTLINSDIIIPQNIVSIGSQYIYGDHSSYNFKILGDVGDMDISNQGGMQFKNLQIINNIKVIEGVAIAVLVWDSLIFDGSVIKNISSGLCAGDNGGKITNVTIGEGVIRLCLGVFNGCDNSSFTTITIPSSVNYVGDRCFQNTILTNATFNQPLNMKIRLPRAGGSALAVSGMLYTKTARNMTIKTNNYDIANYDYNADGITATIVHLDDSVWNKTTMPTLSLNGDILTISGSNADKYYVDGGITYDLVETEQTTINLKTAFPSFTSGTAYTIKVTGIKTDTSYCRSDTASVSYTPS